MDKPFKSHQSEVVEEAEEVTDLAVPEADQKSPTMRTETRWSMFNTDPLRSLRTQQP